MPSNKKASFFIRNFGNIRIQLALWNALFFFLIISVIAGYFYFGFQRALYKGAMSFLGHEAQEVANVLKRQHFDPELKQWIINELAQRPEYAISYEIYDAKGEQVSRYGNDLFQQAFSQVRGPLRRLNSEILLKTKDSRGRTYHIAAYIAADEKGKELYYVFLGSYLKSVREKMSFYKKEILWALPLFFIGALIFGWVLAGTVLGPVRKITKKMKAITIDRLDERIRLRGSGDDLDRLTSTFNTMLARIQESYQRISQFTSDASHELKTPISIMKNQIEVTLGKERKPAEYQQVLVSHLEELERLSQLIEKMLFLARADNGQIKLQSERVPVDWLLTELWDYFEPIQDEKDIHLMKKEHSPVSVRGDKILLRQLLFILVDNAIRYNRKGGKVSVEAFAENHHAVIKISDTGYGIASEDLEKIFDRFYRIDRSRSMEVTGHGLGLSICKAIVQAHDGTIHVESRLGEGTRFTITLPT